MTSDFLWGALAMGCFIAALFFLRYWRLTGDRLFAFFFLAFCLFATEWTAAATIYRDDTTKIYVLRLLAFLLLVVGIVDKNRRAKP